MGNKPSNPPPRRPTERKPVTSFEEKRALNRKWINIFYNKQYELIRAMFNLIGSYGEAIGKGPIVSRILKTGLFNFDYNKPEEQIPTTNCVTKINNLIQERDINSLTDEEINHICGFLDSFIDILLWSPYRSFVNDMKHDFYKTPFTNENELDYNKVKHRRDFGRSLTNAIHGARTALKHASSIYKQNLEITNNVIKALNKENKILEDESVELTDDEEI